jgi:signal transduction histidine kinase
MDGRRVVSGGSGPAPGELVLTVWNSGSYIPPDERQRLFEPFYTKKSGGTGLGLAIVQTIATEHGGQVTVDSDPERGTSFALRLPVSRPSALLDPSEQAETAVVP